MSNNIMGEWKGVSTGPRLRASQCHDPTGGKAHDGLIQGADGVVLQHGLEVARKAQVGQVQFLAGHGAGLAHGLKEFLARFRAGAAAVGGAAHADIHLAPGPAQHGILQVVLQLQLHGEGGVGQALRTGGRFRPEHQEFAGFQRQQVMRRGGLAAQAGHRCPQALHQQRFDACGDFFSVQVAHQHVVHHAHQQHVQGLVPGHHVAYGGVRGVGRMRVACRIGCGREGCRGIGCSAGRGAGKGLNDFNPREGRRGVCGVRGARRQAARVRCMSRVVAPAAQHFQKRLQPGMLHVSPRIRVGHGDGCAPDMVRNERCVAPRQGSGPACVALPIMRRQRHGGVKTVSGTDWARTGECVVRWPLAPEGVVTVA
ncbi:hypothetical protein [Nitratidesulfovibrio liaohensis]|uniref:Uncharacterized protein n=1 Tax=Nitratidesulfovibrio liaohensis TaxID=2604158 RepID=A0ABY9R3K6_9BACT|nr:hypothetical protein [Nitratidesulfovibrio liaohensis]WMW66182.1 hypothetical protein KPS_000739 [Nitratidesulfovibrio liaohensis]